MEISEKLQKVMLDYYSILLTEKTEALKEKKEQESTLLVIWDKFKNLKEKKVIEDLFALAVQKIKNDEFVTDPIDKTYFLNQGIDLDYGIDLGLMRSYKIGNVCYSYFNNYPEEKVKWNNIKLELKKKLDKFKSDFDIEKYRSKIDKFFDRAVSMNLQDVTSSHIKNIADELGEDINGVISQLTIAVSVRLKKHWGNNLPKYNKRGVTSSRRIDVLSRDGYICDQCGRTKEEVGLHIQHIIPESQGGTDEMDNLITLCKDCNLSIGNSKYNPSDKWIKKIGKHIYKKWGKR